MHESFTQLDPRNVLGEGLVHLNNGPHHLTINLNKDFNRQTQIAGVIEVGLVPESHLGLVQVLNDSVLNPVEIPDDLLVAIVVLVSSEVVTALTRIHIAPTVHPGVGLSVEVLVVAVARLHSVSGLLVLVVDSHHLSVL
jgi:hypothetical protein